MSAPDDERYAEWALRDRRIPQPETLERFVREARKDPSKWPAARANAIEQRMLWGER